MSTLTVPLAGQSADVLTQGVPEEFKVTTLPNGFRVVSVETFSAGSVVGLVAKAGSRHETSELPFGTAHALARLALKSTDRTTSFRRTVDIESQTSCFKATASREQLRYVAHLPRANVGEFISTTLLDTLSPTVHEYEVDEVRETLREDAIALSPEVRAKNALFREAYDCRTVGRPTFPCPAWADAVSHLHIRQFLSSTLRPDRLALVGVGVDHAFLVDQALKTVSAAPALADAAPAQQDAAAQYYGGRYRIALPASRSTVAVGFDGKGVKGSHLQVIAKLLTAKGVATGFAEVLSDAALVGLVAANENQAAAVALVKGLKSASDAAIKAAIQQALFDAQAQLETRAGTFDVLAAHAFLPSLPSRADFAKAYQSLTPQDVKASIAKILSTPSTIASYGRSDNIIRAQDL